MRVQVAWAYEVSREKLVTMTDRWSHVQGVGRRAKDIGGAVDESERDLLVAAAYLHDVGYAPGLQQTGAHQLDGARFARSLGAPDRLVGLIAHHSESRFELEMRGLRSVLEQFPRERSTVYDALVYCDLTTGPTGQSVNPSSRLAEVRERYEAGGVVLRALQLATPHLLEAVERTEERLREAGMADLLV